MRASLLCQLARRSSSLSRTAPAVTRAFTPALREPALASCKPALSWRALSTSGRSAADSLSDALHDANLLLSDLADEDDRSSEDFQQDLEELRAAYATVVEAYDGALASEAGAAKVAVQKNFELAVVGLRDKLSALEAEAEAAA